MDAILGEVKIGRRRQKLQEVARGKVLSDAYTATLERLKAQGGEGSRLGMEALIWVLYSERPLRAEELCHALGVKIGSADMDPDNISPFHIVLACCVGLVTVENISSTVRPAHSTLQDHLLSDPTLPHSPHSWIAEVCLTYLNFRCLWDPSPTPESAPPATPFHEYFRTRLQHSGWRERSGPVWKRSICIVVEI